MANIPKKIHFIWVGNPIPDKYITNILLWKQKNPEYEINLWIDSDSVAPHQIHCALAKAQIAGVKTRDLSDDKKSFLTHPNTRNGNLYVEEATGVHANYAAASDILRLEILFHEGGVYIDTDTLPTDVPLGDIDTPAGFAKPPGGTNDVLCALPNSVLIDEIRLMLNNQYMAAYSGDDLCTNQRLDMHRSIRPWKARLDTTLEWSGPDIILSVIQKHSNALLGLNETTGANADSFARSVFQLELQTKFLTQSDKTWLDPGPQNIAENNRYLTEEFKFRFKYCFMKALHDIILKAQCTKSPDKATIIETALGNLSNNVILLGEWISITTIVQTWQVHQPKEVITELNKVLHLATQIESQIASLYFHTPHDIEEFKKSLFPSERYHPITSTINMGMASNIDLQMCRKTLQPFLPTPPSKYKLF